MVIERGWGLRARIHCAAGGAGGGTEACGLTVIGEVVEEGIWMERGGERRRVEAKGYEHRIGTGSQILTTI